MKVSPAAGQEWTNVFADSRVIVVHGVQVPAGFRGSLAWTLADAGTNRVLPRGRGELAIAAGDTVAKFALDFPPLNDGVVLKAKLKVALIAAGKNETVAEHARTLWIFSANPFTGGQKALEELKITLYDPDPKQLTAEAFTSLKVPFERVASAAALAESKARVIIVGEGVSFDEEPELLKMVLPLAKRGALVICLAPVRGSLAIPGLESGDANVSLKRRGVVTELDPRLDAVSWLDAAEPVSAAIAVKGGDGNVVGEVVPGSRHFPWVQVDYTESKGRFIICGFGVISHWNRTPTPRYLLNALLQIAARQSG